MPRADGDVLLVYCTKYKKFVMARFQPALDTWQIALIWGRWFSRCLFILTRPTEVSAQYLTCLLLKPAITRAFFSGSLIGIFHDEIFHGILNDTFECTAA